MGQGQEAERWEEEAAGALLAGAALRSPGRTMPLHGIVAEAWQTRGRRVADVWQTSQNVWQT